MEDSTTTADDTNVTPYAENGLIPGPTPVEDDEYVFSLSQLGIPFASTAIIVFGEFMESP